MSLQLRLSNTYSKQLELFTPIDPSQVFLYVCGITPYDFAHIGHARCYLSFDLLVRTLQFLGYQTTYIRNYTDIDDKLLDKARQQGDEMQYLQIAEEFIRDFELQMQNLGCLKPNFEPRATQCIDEMIVLINNLLEQGFAYMSGDDVYFDISTLKQYGQLSGKNIDELCAGARVSLDRNKKNAGDFVLWKGNKHNKFWDAPFGFGRPGWHIECSAMIAKHCPKRPLDIHAGGYDLIFPHHENEIAQSESACGYRLANYWLHNAFVNIGKEKMSKSLGNSVSLKQLFAQVEPMTFRFYIMQHSYTKPIELCVESLRGSKKPLEKLSRLFLNIEPAEIRTHQQLTQALHNAPAEIQSMFNEICAFLVDDLNSSAILGLIFKSYEQIDAWQASHKSLLAAFITNVLGLNLTLDNETPEISAEIQALIAAREQARANKDFASADQIRDQLSTLGYEIKDKKL